MVSVGADMPYLAGYEAPQLERLTMLIAAGRGRGIAAGARDWRRRR